MASTVLRLNAFATTYAVPTTFCGRSLHLKTSAIPSCIPPYAAHSLSISATTAKSPPLPPPASQYGVRKPEYVPNRIADPKYVRVFDTTLRDGEQSPGAALTKEQKLVIARKLAELGVDVIEAGFPAASSADFEAVKAIAETVGNDIVEESGYVPVICALSRCRKDDVAAAWEAVKQAKRPRIHVFISTSDIHMEHKLRKTREEVVEMASSMVRYARSLGCADVEFGAEDAGRSEKEYLYKILGEVIKAGASTLNIADTVGINMPNEFGQLISDIKANTPGINHVLLSTHCQNDLGLATANTISGICAGARQVEVTINGIGERGGNASLEEVVMALKCRGENIFGGLYTGIDTRHIIPTSKLVEEYTGLHVQPHKAIVGSNAFAHESGIHQDGMLKNKNTYEIMLPEDVGLQRSHELGIVLGKLSGRHALKDRLIQLGYEIDDTKLNNVFSRFKAVAEQKKRVTDADLIALVSEVETSHSQLTWKLQEVQVVSGTLGGSTAIVTLVDPKGNEHTACYVGNGPINSAFKAVDLIVKEPVTLLEYSVDGISEGVDSIATTRVSIQKKTKSISTNESHETFNGMGVGTDIVVSSVKAYIGALNKMMKSKKINIHEGNGTFPTQRFQPSSF